MFDVTTNICVITLAAEREKDKTASEPMIYQEIRNYYEKKISYIYTHNDDRLKYDYSNNILQPILLIYCLTTRRVLSVYSVQLCQGMKSYLPVGRK